MSIPSSSEDLQIANWLREAGDLLEGQGASPYRINAYRRAADRIADLDRPLAKIFSAEGLRGLVALPDIGNGIARAIAEMLETGRWSLLERLRGSLEPEQLLRSLPGVGPELARRIHDTLDVDSLEALELAVYDGRIEKVPGIGPRRAEALRAALDARLTRRLRRRSAGHDSPSVAMILDVDAEYRARSERGQLRRIAPRRFNPGGEAWLPVLHTDRDPWHFTALFSNTARAHHLGRTHDWVVIYFYDGDHLHEGQHTVVTEHRGLLTGRRVVRGRETECRAHYETVDFRASRATLPDMPHHLDGWGSPQVAVR